MKHYAGMFLLVLSTAVVVTGCEPERKIKVDAQQSIDGIRTEAGSLQGKELQRYALAYSEEIQKTKAKMKDLQGQLRQLQPAELAGAKADKIKSEFAALTLKATQLTKRYDIYAQKYLQEGGSLSEITASS